MASQQQLQQQPQQFNQELNLLQQQRTFLASVRPKSPLDVFKSTNRSLAFLINENKSDAYVRAVLTILISDTADFLNIGKTINGPQIMQTVELILEDFSVYKIDFFVACFNKAKKGFYGKQYDRLDGQIIFEWLTQYEYEYQSEIERLRSVEKTLVEQGKISLAADAPDQKLICDRDNTPVPMPDYVKEDFLKIVYRPVIISEQPARTEAQMIMDGFIEDFNRIHKAQNDFSGGTRLVAIYGAPGKSMDIPEYIEYRVLEYETGLSLEECLKEIKRQKIEHLRNLKQKRR